MTYFNEEYWKWFSVDYLDARKKFLQAARKADATIHSYAHPTEFGPNNEALFIDVAYIGKAHAPKVLLVISGTHGLEGPAGSAIQTAWLDTLTQPLPDDVAVVYVHALNPYGFAYATRTNESNVDLNRNFIDYSISPPENKDYALLHPSFVTKEWSAQSQDKVFHALEAYHTQNGEDALVNARASGQYAFSDGLFYGGSKREWSNLTLQTIIEQHLQQAQQVAFIDWHTGLGEYAKPYFLCFNDTDSTYQKEVVRWWGYDQVIGQHLTGVKRPDYKGLVFRGAETFVGGRPLAGAVIEFGTRNDLTSEALRLDQWLRFEAINHPNKERDLLLKADLKDIFVPVSSFWRRSVIHHGLHITQQTIDGLSSWKI